MPEPIDKWLKVADVAIANTIFDVVAKYWDAELNRFMYRRVCDCVLVNGEVCASIGGEAAKITQHGYRAEYWMPVPEIPEALRSEVIGNG